MLNVQIKQTEPATVAYAVMHGPYAQIPEGYGRLYEWVGRHGLQPVGMPAAVYLTAPGETPEQDARWELWAPVAPTLSEVAATDEGMGIKTLGQETVASATHKGPYDTVASTYEALGAWIQEHNYAIVGPPREIYLSDPEKVAPEDTLTEIQFPVLRIA